MVSFATTARYDGCRIPTTRAVDDDVAKEGFSGKQWLSHYGNQPGTATYAFDSKEGGDFVFWLRCNYFACEMDMQLNGGAWNAATTSNYWTNWTASSLGLSSGTNIIQAYAVDRAGNTSFTNTLKFFH